MPNPNNLPSPICPPGLLAVADLLARVPERKKDLLAVERERRELERMRLVEERQRYSWHPWSTAKLLVVSGSSAFFIAWGAGMLADFLKLYDQTVNKANAIPAAALGGFSIPSLNSIVPKEATNIVAQIPHIGAKESFLVALGIILSIAFIKLIVILVNWKKIKLIQSAEKRIAEEIKTIEGWGEGIW